MTDKACATRRPTLESRLSWETMQPPSRAADNRGFSDDPLGAYIHCRRGLVKAIRHGGYKSHYRPEGGHPH